MNDPGNVKARAAFLADIISTAIEGGIGYWSTCDVYQWVDHAGAVPCVNVEACKVSGRDDAFAIIREIDEDAYGYSHDPLIIDGETVARGIRRLCNGTVSYPASSVLRLQLASSELDAAKGDIDADDADCIVQAGLFGEIRYG